MIISHINGYYVNTNTNLGIRSLISHDKTNRHNRNTDQKNNNHNAYYEFLCTFVASSLRLLWAHSIDLMLLREQNGCSKLPLIISTPLSQTLNCAMITLWDGTVFWTEWVSSAVFFGFVLYIPIAIVFRSIMQLHKFTWFACKCLTRHIDTHWNTIDFITMLLLLLGI